MSKKKMVIDTDSGTDDLLAIMFALSRSDWEILAITVTFGNINVHQAYNNVLRLLQLCDKTHIPVFKGSQGPLLGGKVSFDGFHGCDGMGGKSDEFILPNINLQEKHAVNELVEIVKEFPNEITLISLGPLTNLALALRIDQPFSKSLKQLVVMGGTARAQGNYTPVSEFNFHSDPEAASVVITEFECDKLIVPYETCVQSYIHWDRYAELISLETPKAKFMRRITELTSARMKNVLKRLGFVCCDLVAMAALVLPECIKTEKRHVTIETNGTHTRGQMVVDYRNHSESVPNVSICLDLDAEIMYENFKNMVNLE